MRAVAWVGLELVDVCDERGAGLLSREYNDVEQQVVIDKCGARREGAEEGLCVLLLWVR